MSRAIFLKNKQSDFLNKIKKAHRLRWSDVAKICDIHQRTLFDWRRNKYNMNYEALQILKQKYRLFIPEKMKVLPDDWNIVNIARLGAIRRNELYGSPGTFEGRRKGGLISSYKFRTNSEIAAKQGLKSRKQVAYPGKSSLLAEFIGIVLGDGSVTKYQVRISTNSKTDSAYAHFIKKIIKVLFKTTASIVTRKKNATDVIISSRNIVTFLVNCGLKEGNKIKQGVDVPPWVFKDKKLIKGCLRGLIDTDGGLYFHNHTIKNIRYKNLGLCFTSHSKLLLDSAYRMFLGLGIAAKNDTKRHVSVYDYEEINKYMLRVGSHNPKHIRKFRSYRSPM